MPYRFLFFVLLFFCGSLPLHAQQQMPTDDYLLKVETLATGLEHPWSMVFLPEGGALISERSGRLRLFDQGRLLPNPIPGLPRIDATGQGGLLDLALHPQFTQNRWLYFSYVDRTTEGYTTRLARARYENQQLRQVEVLFTALPRSTGGRHFGGRLVFDDEGFLYLSIGDRGTMDRAQDRSDHAGSIIRLSDEGLSEVYAWGTRNAQGMTLHPVTREVWFQEHGPRGGDEVNLLRQGLNYGWPRVTHGIDYSGRQITPHVDLPGMEPPLWHWTPSIAPSGMMFYTGELFPRWQGQLFVGALAGRLISRLTVEQVGVVWQLEEQERFLQQAGYRIRDVRQAPDASIWVLTDERDGRLLRLSPVL